MDKLAGDSKNIDFLIDVINLLPNPVYVKDKDHVWVEVNTAFCELLGYSREYLLGKSDFDVSPPDQAQIFWDKDNDLFKSKESNTNIEQTTNSQGEVRWVESVKSYYEDAQGDPFLIGVLTDITELKNREQDLMIAQQKAVEAARVKSEFLANMSHEIRTPMNGVLGMTQVLSGTSLSEEQSELVEVIQRSGDALLTIINDILDFSKIEAGKFSLDEAPFQLREAVEDVAALLGSTANKKGIELIVNVKEAAPVTLIGDVGRLRQVLINLVGNAIKFTEKGYVIADVDSRVEGDKAVMDFSVRDTGIGIEEDKLNKIFNEFEQADGSTTRNFGGTGLGLAISRKMVELMGGNIEVSSVYGKGSTFSFTIKLPFSAGQEKAAPASDTQKDFSNIRALIVDDIEVNRRIVASELSRLSMQVSTAEGPKTAVRLLVEAIKNKTPFDFIICDYQMPDIDGLQFVRALQKQAVLKDIPVIVLSSVDTTETKTAFLDQNVSRYLVKPVRSAALKQAILRVVERETDGPKADGFSKPTKIYERPEAETLPVLSNSRILIAEDNDINIQVLKRSLDPKGYALDFAVNGEIAFEMFQRNDYDLVLMDISMPVMDGTEAARLIRKFETETTREATPIIALSAHASDDHRDKFLRAGMDDFLAKPYKLDVLLQKMENWLNEPRKMAG
ncbi:response regulator [Litorimonas sp.]|uniref:PAS domain-containing hybrid sensor histidine kinase/response regulator n=1 Tax=Litorimonas sp. TaxID=1892381 RepID=UPI003A87B291